MNQRKEHFNFCIHSVLNYAENTLLFFMLFCLSFPVSRGGENCKMNARILFFVSYHTPCLQPFPSRQGTSIRCFYSSYSHRLILVVWTAGWQMHFPFCLRLSQYLKKWRGGKKLFCHIKTRTSSMSHVSFLISSLLVTLEWISLPIFLTGSLGFI